MSEIIDAADRPTHSVAPVTAGGIGEVIGGTAFVPKLWTNLPKETRAQRALISRCMAEPSLDNSKVIGERFDLIGVLAHTYETVDKGTGELQVLTRIVLARADGQTVAFVSQGMMKAVTMLLLLEGQGPWKEPLPIKVHAVKLSHGGRTFNVELLAEPGEPARRGGK